ncbi:alcohol dehydrogenase [Carex littledalei]|nr:alcohol dehydrogenase [Carex littledalei]
MCDLLHIKTDRSAMIGDDQSGLSISGKPIYHFVVTSIFNGNCEAAAPKSNEKGAWGCMGLTMTRLKLTVS